MMVNGAVGGLRALAWSFALIAMPLYMVALLMHETLGEESVEDAAGHSTGTEAFTSLSRTWFTLFRCSVAGDCSNEDGRPTFLLIVNRFGWPYAVLFVVSSILMSVGIFNVIAAIFVENTLAAAKFNSTLQKRQRLLNQQFFSEKVAKLVRIVWTAHVQGIEAQADCMVSALSMQSKLMQMTETDVQEASRLQITPEVFAQLCSIREFRTTLEELDINDETHMDLFETLDIDGGGTIDLEEMVAGLTKLRGDARRSDIVSVGLIVRSIQADLKRLRSSIAPAL